MATGKENTRTGAIIGIFSGLFISSLSNGWLTVSANPIAGQGIAQGYIFIIPIIATIITMASIFTDRVKPSTKMRGFLMGFSGITVLVSFVVFSVPNLLNDLLKFFIK